MNNNTIGLYIFLFALFCIVPLLLLAVVVYFAIRSIRSLASPDVARLQLRYAELQKGNPNATQEALLQKIIRREAVKSGVVGAITSIGGFITLPIALPIDILLSLRIQAAMVQFIAMMYHQEQLSENEVKLQNYLVLTGGIQATETSIDLIMDFIVKIIGKSLSKLIPFLGAVVGFGVNYFIATATGNLAMRWYMSRNQLSKNQSPLLHR